MSSLRLGLILAIATGVASAAVADVGIRRRAPLTDEEIQSYLDPQDRIDQRILAARAAVEGQPDSADAYVALGNAYMARGWLIEALNAYRDAQQQDRESLMAWNNAGVTHELLGEYRQSKSAFRQAVLADPLSAEAHYNLAVAYEREGAFDRAVEHFKQAVRLKPDLANPVLNPRVHSSHLAVPVHLSLYLESQGARSLPLMGLRESAALVAPAAAPPPGGERPAGGGNAGAPASE